MNRNFYSPIRIVRIFRFLLTLFLLIKRKEHFLLIPPLSPNSLRESVVTLGVSFIKLAQVLATRADFFSKEYIHELKKIHDEIPPMQESDFETVFARSFDATTFSSFEKKPIASASIGQVHKAVLSDGRTVAVKLRRLHVEKRVKVDLIILKFFNRLFRPLFSYHTKNSIEAVIKEFNAMLLKEVSLREELRNLQKFRAQYATSPICFPTPYPELCSEDALVMSFERGYRFDDKENLQKHSVDFHSVIQTVVDFYVEQMLINGYFHADPHPGNLLINEQGELILLDFGMVKRVPSYTRIAIIELIKAANEKNFSLYVSASKRLGTIPYDAPEVETAELAEKMFDIFSDESLDAQSMQNLAFEVLETMRDLPYKLPQEAIYLLRASAIIEGLGTTYIENFNGVKDILPLLQKNIPKALNGEETYLGVIKKEIMELPILYKNLKHTIHTAAQGELEVQLSKNQTEWIYKRLRGEFKRYYKAISLMLAGIFVIFALPDADTVGIVLFVVGFLLPFF